MRQVRDLPRFSALRDSFPTDARDAPLQLLPDPRGVRQVPLPDPPAPPALPADHPERAQTREVIGGNSEPRAQHLARVLAEEGRRRTDCAWCM